MKSKLYIIVSYDYTYKWNLVPKHIAHATSTEAIQAEFDLEEAIHITNELHDDIHKGDVYQIIFKNHIDATHFALSAVNEHISVIPTEVVMAYVDKRVNEYKARYPNNDYYAKLKERLES